MLRHLATARELALGAAGRAALAALMTAGLVGSSGSVAAVAPVTASSAVGSGVPQADETPPGSWWEMRSEPGDWVGDGRTWRYLSPASTIVARGNEHHVTVTVFGDDATWDADFEAPTGGLLVPGTVVVGAGDHPFNAPDQPGISVSGDARACGSATGSFVVDHAVFDGGEVREFAVRFEQRCGATRPALHGAISWQVAETVDVRPPGPVTDVVVRRTTPRRVVVTWQDPLSTDWRRTAVYGTSSTRAGGGPGERRYVGRDGRVVLTGLPASRYVLTLVTVDRDRLRGVPVRVVVPGLRRPA